MKIALICVAAGGLLAAAIGIGQGATAKTPAPPADLIALERQVSLRIAHVRIQGPNNAADFKLMVEAQRVEAEAEKAMSSGEYEKAERDFLRANALIGRVRQ